MIWEELKEKAKELGFTVSSYTNEDDVELEYIYCNDYIYLEEDGNITTSTENIVDDTLYYLAKIAEEDGDAMKAKEYYNKIVKEYPDSNQITNVKNALQQLNESSN